MLKCKEVVCQKIVDCLKKLRRFNKAVFAPKKVYRKHVFYAKKAYKKIRFKWPVLKCHYHLFFL